MKKIISLFLTTIIIISCVSINVFAEDLTDYSILKTLEIMVGDEDGNMRLDDKITRAEFTKVASTISSFRKSIPISQKSSPFSDVPYTHWASAYIKAGVENGIVSGYPDSTFKPEKNVLYEEALTILLKILGYTDADFGDSYPYGQYSIANNIDLTEDVNAELFNELTRRQVADLLVNALNTKIKNTQQTPYNNFDVTKIEDSIILASNIEDSAVPSNKIVTTTGTYEFTNNMTEFVGLKGDIILKDGKTIIYFEPTDEDKFAKLDKYVVYSSVSDGVIVYQNKDFSQINIQDNTTAYYNNNPTTFTNVKNALTMGDTIYIKKDINNEIDYINIYKGNLDGPYIFKGYTSLTQTISNVDNYTVLRDGNTIDVTELETNDVYYYSTELEILMAYSTKITGVYNSATPNQETPISVDISGKIYEIEGGEAFQSLSSTGQFKYGDTVTILLGKDKKIAGVVSPNGVKNEIVGFVSGVGIKNYTNNKEKEQSHYFVNIVTPNGQSIEYKAKRDYSSWLNTIVEVTFDGELVTLSKIREDNYKLSGKFNYSALTLDKYSLSKNIEIIDIYNTDSNDITKYVSIKPQRIDGVSLSSSNVLYYETNEKNIITKLILKGVTNDYYEYGIITDVDKQEEILAASYKYNVNGSELGFATQNKVFGVNVGPAKFMFNNQTVDAVSNLTKISGTIKDINTNYITVGSTHYEIDNNVKIFYKNWDYDYLLIDIEDLVSKDSEYKISGAYYDKKPTSGGKIRVILVTK